MSHKIEARGVFTNHVVQSDPMERQAGTTRQTDNPRRAGNAMGNIDDASGPVGSRLSHLIEAHARTSWVGAPPLSDKTKFVSL